MLPPPSPLPTNWRKRRRGQGRRAGVAIIWIPSKRAPYSWSTTNFLVGHLRAVNQTAAKQQLQPTLSNIPNSGMLTRPVNKSKLTKHKLQKPSQNYDNGQQVHMLNNPATTVRRPFLPRYQLATANATQNFPGSWMHVVTE